MNTPIVLVGLGAAVLLSACSSGSSGGSPPVTVKPPKHTHTAPPSTPTPVTTVTVTASNSAPPAPPIASSTPTCSSSHLALSLGQGQGAAGSSYVPVVLTNTGTAKCKLYGFPGVSFVDASGALIGKPAAETGSKRGVTLTSGAAASALLKEPDPGNFDPSDCKATTADRLRVYPPGNTVALFIKDQIQVCTTALGRTYIQTLVPGNTGGQ